ncbi:DegT/DnrJ/EryC1/StrS family aminotransferase [Rhodovulum kholense]|uniref:dTDP-4-amino-4,6-dideoxygalactose transaminase n=1 Tax=Rhodovulum kholense TaxID=453584 RepID=A0A8E2VJQ5_9RHOB|nr:DegT/DnrJ/EryC1/StrS family aminotransferase [Rhodovulum kholense]PTW49904.1 dTDP-4-amino-4,6-dideoxygalactose transaminase [Rhodovulum kholense]
MARRFTRSFTQQEPLSEAAIEAAVAVLRHGRLHRYNLAEAEAGEVALLEEEFAGFTGARFALAVASGGYALACALRALQVRPDEPVLTNAFTLAPVPGAIASLGARPVLVEVTPDLVIDLDHLEARIAETGARVLLLSHMRGHICDMDRLMAICDGAGVRVIEDCAHTMGAAWNGVASGRHGAMACYSTQTYKHLNSGEGGLLISDDPELMARAVLLSGSYMMYPRHRAAPAPEVFEGLWTEVPNVSGRMDALRAAILRPQLADLPGRIVRWAGLYRALENGLRASPGLALIERPAAESFVGSSFQARLPDWTPDRIEALVARCAARGVELKWFGAAQPQGFTSRYAHWGYAAPEPLPRTDRVLAGLIDLRLPLTFTPEDCRVIAEILDEEIRRDSPRSI